MREFRGFSPTVVSRHCWRSSDTLAGSPATTWARGAVLTAGCAAADADWAGRCRGRRASRHLGRRSRQAARHPEHPHRHDGPVFVRLRVARRAAPARRRRVLARAAAAPRAWARDGAPLLVQPVVQQIRFGRRRRPPPAPASSSLVVKRPDVGGLRASRPSLRPRCAGLSLGRLARWRLLGRGLFRGRLLRGRLLRGRSSSRGSWRVPSWPRPSWRAPWRGLWQARPCAAPAFCDTRRGRATRRCGQFCQRVEIELADLGDALGRVSPRVQSATGIGGNTATSTVPGFIVVESRAAMTSALRITIGTTGIPTAIAIRNGPFLNGPTSVVSSRVPSGAMRIESPCRASSSTLMQRLDRRGSGRRDR